MEHKMWKRLTIRVLVIPFPSFFLKDPSCGVADFATNKRRKFWQVEQTTVGTWFILSSQPTMRAYRFNVNLVPQLASCSVLTEIKAGRKCLISTNCMLPARSFLSAFRIEKWDPSVRPLVLHFPNVLHEVRFEFYIKKFPLISERRPQ